MRVTFPAVSFNVVFCFAVSGVFAGMVSGKTYNTMEQVPGAGGQVPEGADLTPDTRYPAPYNLLLLLNPLLD
jgi:hypothetical protein